MTGVYLFAAITFTLGIALAGAAIREFADLKRANAAINDAADCFGAVEGMVDHDHTQLIMTGAERDHG